MREADHRHDVCGDGGLQRIHRGSRETLEIGLESFPLNGSVVCAATEHSTATRGAMHLHNRFIKCSVVRCS